MTPEVLIVGDVDRRADLQTRIQGLGYEARVVTRQRLEERVSRARPPSGVVVCTGDVEPGALMKELRSTRRGSGVPVTLHGPLEDRFRDLAEVLDLGADHFLEEPASDEQLAAALQELVGPGQPVAAATSEARREGEPAPRTGGSGATDAVLGQLHRTLDMLEARLREREHGDGDADDLDLAELGFAPLPDVGEQPRPATSTDASLELSVPGSGALGPGTATRREATERLKKTRKRPRTGPTPPGAPDRPRRRAPLPIEDRGSLERVEVPRLLWTLHRAQYSGALSLEHGRQDKRLWWRDGDLVLARSNVAHDRFVDGLLRRGLLTREQYDAARGMAAKEPGRLGPQLVEAGFLKPAELPRELRNHLIRIIDSTFPWTEGRWSLEPDDIREGEALADTPVALVIAEGVRHRLESAQLLARLGGADQHPRFRGEAAVVGGARQLAERLLLAPSEEAWLDRLDGSHSLRQLLDRPETDELELLGLVYLLHVLDHLELGPGVRGASDLDVVAVDTERIRDRLRAAREADYFAILGLPRDAARLEVRRAHADLRRTFADENLEPSVLQTLRTELAELRELLDEARDVLADEALRSAYLAHLEEP